MALEEITSGAAHTIANLVPTNPAGGDDVAQGDDHIRNIKKALQLTFPHISATVNAVAAELDFAYKGGTVSGNAVIKGSLDVSATLSAAMANLSAVAAQSVSISVLVANRATLSTLTAVSGAVVKVGLTVEGDAAINGNDPSYKIKQLSGTMRAQVQFVSSVSRMRFILLDSTGSAMLNYMELYSGGINGRIDNAISASRALIADGALSAVRADSAIAAKSASTAQYALTSLHAASADLATHAAEASAVNGCIVGGGAFRTWSSVYQTPWYITTLTLFNNQHVQITHENGNIRVSAVGGAKLLMLGVNPGDYSPRVYGELAPPVIYSNLYGRVYRSNIEYSAGITASTNYGTASVYISWIVKVP